MIAPAEKRATSGPATRHLGLNGVDQATTFLRSMLADSMNITQLRHTLVREGTGVDVSRLSDHQVLDLMARKVVSGNMHVRGVVASRAGVGATVPVEAEPEEPVAAPPPVEPEKKTTFIKVELQDMEGGPMVGERYRVTLPNGDVKEGRLDSRGAVRFEEQEFDETAKITFPDLDEEAWEAA